LSVNEAKAHFSAVLKLVEGGETVLVTRHDRPVAEMRPVATGKRPVLGAFADPTGPHLEVNWTEAELEELFAEPSPDRDGAA